MTTGQKHILSEAFLQCEVRIRKVCISYEKTVAMELKAIILLGMSISVIHGKHINNDEGGDDVQFATGIVSENCLRCICEQESGCTAMGCRSNGQSDVCGYFQISYDYWVDCGKPGTNWQACADDLMCASSCVQKYMERYAKNFNCPLTCESYAREHFGGSTGCHHASTLHYWHEVQARGCQ